MSEGWVAQAELKAHSTHISSDGMPLSQEKYRLHDNDVTVDEMEDVKAD